MLIRRPRPFLLINSLAKVESYKKRRKGKRLITNTPFPNNL